MNNRKVVVEAEPFKKYDERKYCVLVWFMSSVWMKYYLINPTSTQILN